jgi:hypothetical protein
MNATFDLNLLPLIREAGLEQSELPGLYAVTPPRRTARGRDSDRLILYLSMAGNAPLAPEQYPQLLARLTQTYYKTSGSVTTAMRATAEALNIYLLDRNLHSTSAGRQGIGLFILAVVRPETVYLAHCGPVHCFAVRPQETQHYYDPHGGGRGLGLSKTTPIRYYQVQVNSGDYLLFSTQAPASWSEEPPRFSGRSGMEGMRRQLLERAGADFSAVLVQVQAGDGRLRLMRRRSGIPEMAHSLPESEKQAQPAPQAGIAPDAVIHLPAATTQSPVAIYPEDQPLTMPSETQADTQPKQELATQTSRTPQISAHPTASVASPSQVQQIASSGVQRVGLAEASKPTTQAAQPVSEEHSTPSKPGKQKSAQTRSPKIQPLLASGLSVLAALGRALSHTIDTLRIAIIGLLRRILPDESLLHIPTSVMIFFAIAVPLILATIGGMVYVQRGRAQQHTQYVTQAQQAILQAEGLTDVSEQRKAWVVALGYLEQASFYGNTPESQALSIQARAALDQMDGVERLDFLPALASDLGDEAQITQMSATLNELYLLDSSQGVVRRAILTGRGYELDPGFKCGPSFGITIVGPIIDIVGLTHSLDSNGVLLAMDANGNLLYCSTDGEQPESEGLAPPLTNFGGLKAMTLDSGNFYALDPPVNAVWIYPAMDFANQPRLFFSDQVPPMQDVIDLAVTNNDLYLLHTDGHLTTCTYSGIDVSPTRCVDPALYSDPRPARTNSPVIQDAVFSQVYYSPPPDPSIYLLDPQNQSIYHFSLRLAFQRQFRPSEKLPGGSATAFAISPNRTVLMAVSGQIYYALLP